MDAAEDLRARRDKALEFTHAAGEISLTLRAPTRTELRECLHRHQLLGHADDALVMPLLQHYLLLRAIVGWTGVRVRDVLPGSDGAAPLPWSPDNVALYLDANPEIETTLGQEVLARVRTRGERIEEDAKN